MKTKTILSIMMGMLMIGLASAQIAVSPSTLSLSGYPGDEISKNVTITTDGNYAVYLNHSASSSEIAMNYTSPLIVEKSRQVELKFIFSGNITPGVYNIKITASTEAYDDVIPGSSSSAGSSSGSILYKYWDGTGWTISKPNMTSSQTQTLNISDTQINNSSDDYNNQTGMGISEPQQGFWARLWSWIKSLFE